MRGKYFAALLGAAALALLPGTVEHAARADSQGTPPRLAHSAASSTTAVM